MTRSVKTGAPRRNAVNKNKTKQSNGAFIPPRPSSTANASNLSAMSSTFAPTVSDAIVLWIDRNNRLSSWQWTDRPWSLRRPSFASTVWVWNLGLTSSFVSNHANIWQWMHRTVTVKRICGPYVIHLSFMKVRVRMSLINTYTHPNASKRIGKAGANCQQQQQHFRLYSTLLVLHG